MLDQRNFVSHAGAMHVRAAVAIAWLTVVPFASSATGQSKWAGHFPPPVRVASLEPLTQPTDSPERSSVAPAAFTETSRQLLRPIEHDGRWVEMPPSSQNHVSPEQSQFAPHHEIAYQGLPAPPHRVIQAPQPDPPARHQPFSHSTPYLYPAHAMGPDPAMEPDHAMAYDDRPIGNHDSFTGALPQGNPGYSGHAGYPAEPGSHTADRSALRRPHHLPEFPGVENDPSSAGPGYLGAGTNWLRTRPGPRQMIPNAVVQPAWKAPYSYGYFGAQGKRQWTRQTGYRDRYQQWTLR